MLGACQPFLKACLVPGSEPRGVDLAAVWIGAIRGIGPRYRTVLMVEWEPFAGWLLANVQAAMYDDDVLRPIVVAHALGGIGATPDPMAERPDRLAEPTYLRWVIRNYRELDPTGTA